MSLILTTVGLMLSLGLSIDFRDVNLNQVSGLISNDMVISSLLCSFKVGERDDQLCLGSCKPQLELENGNVADSLVNCSLDLSIAIWKTQQVPLKMTSSS